MKKIMTRKVATEINTSRMDAKKGSPNREYKSSTWLPFTQSAYPKKL